MKKILLLIAKIIYDIGSYCMGITMIALIIYGIVKGIKMGITHWMKLIIITLCLTTLCASAQVNRFTATQFICTKYMGQNLDPPEFHDLKNMPIEYDENKNIVYIHSPALQTFRLGAPVLMDDAEDSLCKYHYEAIDHKGKKCILTEIIFKTKKPDHFAVFMLEYPDKAYWYYVEKAD